MNKNRYKQLMPSVLATGGIFVFGGVLFFLYGQSKYLLFLLGGIFLSMLALINLILLLFSPELRTPEPKIKKRKRKSDPTTEAPPTSDAPSPTQASEGEETVADSTEEVLSKEKSEESEEKEEKEDKENKENKKPLVTKEKVFCLLKACASGIARAFIKFFRPLEVLLLAATLIGGMIWFTRTIIPKSAPPISLAYWHLVVLVALFVVGIVIDKFCKHVETDSRLAAMLLRNARAFFSLMRIYLVLTTLTVTLQILNIYNMHRYAIYIFAVLAYYSAVMILLSLTVRVIRKELTREPGVVIILPFFNADIKELAVLSFLEENTGITLRSLWSIRYVKRLIPFAVVGAALLFWCATGIVYVQSHQEGAVYRFGVLQEETLDPGLHLTLPYPIEQTELYDTKTINKMTIGYKSTENQDNVWTAAHGEEEYKLLLGSGTELVSINLRIEYRIANLTQYLKTATTPDRVLEAKAYELITKHTMESDLDGMIATNRESFANHFYDEMVEGIAPMNTGLEVVSVILESIHPPVDVAEVYQKFIGAEIDAETTILEAQAQAIQREQSGVAEAYQMVQFANANYLAKIAAAKTEIATFKAAVDASNAYPDEYAYYKYLEALCSAYQKAKLVIVGNGVDSGRLYFGNIDGSN